MNSVVVHRCQRAAAAVSCLALIKPREPTGRSLRWPWPCSHYSAVNPSEAEQNRTRISFHLDLKNQSSGKLVRRQNKLIRSVHQLPSGAISPPASLEPGPSASLTTRRGPIRSDPNRELTGSDRITGASSEFEPEPELDTYSTASNATDLPQHKHL